MLSGIVPTSFWHFLGFADEEHNIRWWNVIFSCINNLRNACKCQCYSQNCWQDFFILWQKVGRIFWSIQLLFYCFLCVRIEIDQLLCKICKVINHSLSVSCKKIDHSCSALVIWSTTVYNFTLLELIYFLNKSLRWNNGDPRQAMSTTWQESVNVHSTTCFYGEQRNLFN